MTYPRSELVKPGQPGFYHCVSRCVRRAFLCGLDPVSGRDLEHRRDWIQDLLLARAESFAVSVLAYAVMHNHWHVVVHLNPRVVKSWSDEEVARRWLKAFPGPLQGSSDPKVLERCVTALVGSQERIQKLRERLGSLSWFMRSMNEPMARWANEEDGCPGRFWEGRFKSQALLDEAAVLACMAYVDLNPVRAGLCDQLQDSNYTSIQKRLGSPADQSAQTTISRQPMTAPLRPIAGLDVNELISATLGSYIELVTWTGTQIRPQGKAMLAGSDWSANQLALLGTLRMPPGTWIRQVRGVESRYYRAIGSAELLVLKASEMGQSWLKGVGMARALQRTSPSTCT